MLRLLITVVGGAVAIILPVWSATRFVELLFKKVLKKDILWLQVLLRILYWLLFEIGGVHLLLDVTIPRHGVITIHAPKEWSTQIPMEHLMVEIRSVKLNGELGKTYEGKFNYLNNEFSKYIELDWFESRVLIRLYLKYDPLNSLLQDYRSVSPYLSIFDTHIYFEDIYKGPNGKEPSIPKLGLLDSAGIEPSHPSVVVYYSNRFVGRDACYIGIEAETTSHWRVIFGRISPLGSNPSEPYYLNEDELNLLMDSNKLVVILYEKSSDRPLDQKPINHRAIRSLGS